MALRPIYLSLDQVKNVGSEASRSIENAGKIFYKDHFIFISERGEGVHIVNNTDPSNPINVAFIRIPANNDVAVKDNILYADNGPDLLAFDISDPTSVVLTTRSEDVFPPVLFPEERGVQFECVDETKGIVVGWEEVELQDPACSR